VTIVTPQTPFGRRRIIDGLRHPSLEQVQQRLDEPASIASTVRTSATRTAATGAGGFAPDVAFLSRCVVLQAVAMALLSGLWIAGLAAKPFEGANAPLCWMIVGIGAVGLLCVFLQRWRDVQWIATHVVRLGLLGTVVGLIIAFSAARHGGSTDPNEVKTMIAAVVDGMYVSLYATLLGIATNLWLKINMRLLGNIDG